MVRTEGARLWLEERQKEPVTGWRSNRRSQSLAGGATEGARRWLEERQKEPVAGWRSDRRGQELAGGATLAARVGEFSRPPELLLYHL
jgi:hypothetical protein